MLKKIINRLSNLKERLILKGELENVQMTINFVVSRIEIIRLMLDQTNLDERLVSKYRNDLDEAMDELITASDERKEIIRKIKELS
jgi:hypothetical protein